MTETVTSKFSLQYRITIPTIIAFWAFAMVICIRYTIINTESDLTSRIEIYAMLLVLTGLFVVKFFLSPPQKIIISKDNITLSSYINHKQRIILYTDIDRTNTMRIKRSIRGGTQYSYQQLQIILKDKEVISFDETDYDNYDSLKAAIYDHAFRGL